MQLSNIILAFMASAAVVMAVPTAEVNENNAEAGWKCPKPWQVCGTCNGTSCKVAGTNRPCRKGSCTKQSGAGDGKICGSRVAIDFDMECPGRSK